MKKRLLALACVLAILAGMLVVPASAADEHVTDTEPYRVGYSKKDINPWVALDIGNGQIIGIPAKYTDKDGNEVEYTDAAAHIITTTIHEPADLGKETVGTKDDASLVAVPLGGYGNAASNPRNVACLTDDNGDGYVSYGDGVYITCTSVTDAYDKTMLFVTIDVTNVSDTQVSEIRTAIVSRLGSKVVKPSDIMVSANHTHAGPILGDCSSAAAGTAYRAYYDHVLNQVVAAAEEAFNGKSAATMSRGSIAASSVMEELGYPQGTKLNFVRQYKTKHKLERYFMNNWQTIAEDVPLVRTSHTGGEFSQEVRTSEGRIYEYRSTFEFVDHVSEVDETLHVLKFEREGGNPIVMVNWRAHSTITGDANWHNISSDYANALRYRLENNSKFVEGGPDYCVAYWQGASGNVNASSSLDENFWKDDYATDDTAKLKPSSGEITEVKVPPKTTTDTFYKGYYNNTNYFEAGNNYDDSIFYNAKYGYLLAKVALRCMEDSMTECETGRIYSRVTKMKLQPQQFTKGEYLAAQKWEDEGSSGSAKTFPYLYDADLVGNDGKTERYILNSRFHANRILLRYPLQFKDSEVDGTPLAIDDQSPVVLDMTTIKLGSQVAMVVLSGEPSDRYSLKAKLDTVNLYNDWEDLMDDTYGTPFVLGYSNDATGYLDNALAHSYNSLAEDNPFYGLYGAGSYGSNSASMKQGSGEAVIAQFATELANMEAGYRTAQCEACGEEVEWTPITKLQAAWDFEDGHYYLTEDITAKDRTSQKAVGTATTTTHVYKEKVCLDLNGHTMERKGLFCRINNGSELNVMDTVGTGGITAHSIASDHLTGGVFVLENGSTMNLYGGKLQFVQDKDAGEEGIARGGVFSISGTLNVYGGTVQGGDLIISPSGALKDKANGCGGAIFVFSAGTLNVSGGQILSGIVPAGGDGGPCVFVAGNGKINISGDAEIDELYFQQNNQKLTVSGNYTGKTALNFASEIISAKATDIGAVEGTYTANNITCQIGGKEYAVEAGGVQWNDEQGIPVGDLMLFETDSVAAVIDKTTYGNVADAIKAYKDNSKYVKLLKDVGDLTVSKNVYLDLNGKNIENVTATNGGKLYCLDTETDDYDIEPNEQGGYTGYGKVTNFDPAVVAAVAVEDSCAEDGYLMVEETDGTSFHRVNLRLTKMTLRAVPEEGDCSPSVYYKSAFGGDQLVADNVASFGVAISIKEDPNEDNMGVSNKYSEIAGFQPGENSSEATSTLLYGIMKKKNTRQTNYSNSTRLIRGRAYIKLTSGAYMFGAKHCQSLVEQTVASDAMWDSLNETQKQSLLTMYETYEDVMKPWNIDTIKNAYAQSKNGNL